MSSGYKRTEAGVMPEDWAVWKLRDCLLAAPDYGIGAPAVPFSDGLPIYIRITDITEDGRLSREDPVSVMHANAGDYYLEPGDVVFARTGASVGKSYLYDAGDGRLVFAGFLVRARPDPSRVVPAYLAAYAATSSYWNWVRQVSTRSGQPGINAQEYGELPVPLPPTITEQQAIADAVGDADTLLASLSRLIAKKRYLKQAVMQRLLTGDTRLPGFRGDWRPEHLGQLGVWRGGATPSMANPAYWENGHIPWASSGDFTGASISETAKSITELAVRETSSPIMPEGSILVVTRSGILRKRLPVAKCLTSVAINQDIKGLEPFPTIDSEFLLQSLLWRGPEVLASCMKAGTTVESVEFSWMKRFQVLMPELLEQRAIAQVLSDMDIELAGLVTRLEKTRDLKQAMMQELLSGRARLI